MLNKRKWKVSIRAALVLAVVSGCAENFPHASGEKEGTAGRRLTGIVTCLEKKVLPRDVLVRVELLDVSGKDGPPRTIAMQEILTGGRQFPIPFDIPYRTAIIDPERAYGLRVKIFDGRNILFSNATPHRVITNGLRSNVDVAVEPVSGSGGGSR